MERTFLQQVESAQRLCEMLSPLGLIQDETVKVLQEMRTYARNTQEPVSDNYKRALRALLIQLNEILEETGVVMS